MAVRFLQLAFCWFCIASPAWAQPAPASLALRVMPVARNISMDQSLPDVLRLLRGGGLSIEEEADLPPDGLTRFVLAVPQNDTCFPRGEQWNCPNVRVHLHRDGARGYRVMRVESYDRLDPALAPTVDEVFAWSSTSRGPALDTATWAERIRGGRLNMWRQRWQDSNQDGVETEIIAALWGDPGMPDDIGSRQDAAVGIGYAHADTGVENFLAALRRRIPHFPGRP